MKRMALAIVALTAAGWCGAQTIHFSPVNLDATQAKPGATWSATIRYPAGPNSAYNLAFDLQRAAIPLSLPGIGQVGLAFSPTFFLMKSGVLDAQGQGGISFGLAPDPNLVGVRYYLQALVATNNSPSGAFVSNLYCGDINAGDSHDQVDGTMKMARALHTMTELQDGRVLIIGGGGGSIATPVGTQVAEIYYPWTQTFDYTRTNSGVITRTTVQRVSHSTTLLNDGRVLIAGGVDNLGNPLASAEVFDPATGQFTAVGAMVRARAVHTATKLPDGRVLITGGTTAMFTFPALFGGSTNTTEIFDPVNSSFTPGPIMKQRRMLHSAVKVRTGGRDYVALFSGIKGLFFLIFPDYTNTAEVYDVTSGTFSGSIGSATIGLMTSRVAAGTAVLPNGQVMIAGGANGTVPAAINRVEVFNPATGGFTSVQSMQQARVLPGVSTISTGRTIVEGGVQGSLTAPTATAKCELYLNGVASPASDLTITRGAQATLVLRSGAVLSVGGADAASNPLSTAEVYTP